MRPYVRLIQGPGGDAAVLRPHLASGIRNLQTNDVEWLVRVLCGKSIPKGRRKREAARSPSSPPVPVPSPRLASPFLSFPSRRHEYSTRQMRSSLLSLRESCPSIPHQAVRASGGQPLALR